MATRLPRDAGAPVQTPVGAGGADCRTCALRSRCISYGWRSPGGLWFEHMVVLRPIPDCRGYVGRSADIRDHFGETDTADPREGRH